MKTFYHPIVETLTHAVDTAMHQQRYTDIHRVFLDAYEDLRKHHHDAAWLQELAEATGEGIAMDPHHAGAGDGAPEVLLEQLERVIGRPWGPKVELDMALMGAVLPLVARIGLKVDFLFELRKGWLEHMMEDDPKSHSLYGLLLGPRGIDREEDFALWLHEKFSYQTWTQGKMALDQWVSQWIEDHDQPPAFLPAWVARMSDQSLTHFLSARDIELSLSTAMTKKQRAKWDQLIRKTHEMGLIHTATLLGKRDLENHVSSPTRTQMGRKM